MILKHYKLNSERGMTDKKKRTYVAKCGQTNLAHGNLATHYSKISCPDCILTLMTEFEERIVTLEDRYEELWPGRPVGEKLQ